MLDRFTSSLLFEGQTFICLTIATPLCHQYFGIFRQFFVQLHSKGDTSWSHDTATSEKKTLPIIFFNRLGIQNITLTKIPGEVDTTEF